jgi:tRNA (guanosine-2'-O-)-methyltransferase
LITFAALETREENIRELTEYLRSFVADTRLARFNEVLSKRTSHVRIVLENIYQAHNASAVLRSCDCFGIQHVHFIENRNSMRISDDIALGSSNWVSIHRHRNAESNTRECLLNMKAKGYRIVCTTPHEKSVSIEELPVDKKFALVFGTELEGITSDAAEMADEFVHVPMYGFTESFNISVCAALCMYEVNRRMRSDGNRYEMSAEEKEIIMLQWLKNTVPQSGALIRRFLDKEK